MLMRLAVCNDPCTTDEPNMEAYCANGTCKTRCVGVYLNCDDAPGCETRGDTKDDCFGCRLECTGLSTCCATSRTCTTLCL